MFNHMSMWCSTMDGSNMIISVYDRANMSLNSLKMAMKSRISHGEQDSTIDTFSITSRVK